MQNRRLQAIILVAGIFVHTLVAGAIAFATPLFNKTPYHTSILTGEGWILELLSGHPRRIHTELGVCSYVFRRLVSALQEAGIGRSRYVSLEEKLGIFLYVEVSPERNDGAPTRAPVYTHRPRSPCISST
jgi:hypothetical protein